MGSSLLPYFTIDLVLCEEFLAKSHGATLVYLITIRYHKYWYDSFLVKNICLIQMVLYLDYFSISA